MNIDSVTRNKPHFNLKVDWLYLSLIIILPILLIFGGPWTKWRLLCSNLDDLSVNVTVHRKMLLLPVIRLKVQQYFLCIFYAKCCGILFQIVGKIPKYANIKVVGRDLDLWGCYFTYMGDAIKFSDHVASQDFSASLQNLIYSFFAFQCVLCSCSEQNWSKYILTLHLVGAFSIFKETSGVKTKNKT